MYFEDIPHRCSLPLVRKGTCNRNAGAKPRPGSVRPEIRLKNRGSGVFSCFRENLQKIRETRESGLKEVLVVPAQEVISHGAGGILVCQRTRRHGSEPFGN